MVVKPLLRSRISQAFLKIEAVAQEGRALIYASEDLQVDRDVVFVAVAQNGGALQYASPALKDNRDVVLAAVAQSRGALQYASQALQGNWDVVLSGFSQDGRPIYSASEESKIYSGFSEKVEYVKMNGRSLLRQYKNPPFYRASVRLAFAKILSARLGGESSGRFVAPDVISLVCDKIKPLSFENLVDYYMTEYPKGMPFETSLACFIQGGTEPEPEPEPEAAAIAAQEERLRMLQGLSEPEPEPE